MHDGQYMHTGEFAVLVAFLFAPPLFMAFAVQAALFSARKQFISRPARRLILVYLATLLGSLLLAFAVERLGTNALKAVLRVRDVTIGGSAWPFLPLAFLTVGIAGAAASWRGLRGDKNLGHH